MNKRVRKAVFPVAGLGTRVLPATKAMAKEMLTVVDKPLIQYAVEEAKQAGIEQFIFVSGRGKVALEDHFDHAFELETTLKARGKEKELAALLRDLPEAGQVSYTRQQEPLGLGHAVWCARHLVGNEPFAVLLPDELLQGSMAQLVETYNQVGGNVISVMDVPRAHTKRYGILAVGKDDGHIAEVTGLVEKPEPEKAPSTLSIIGRYILQPEVFEILDAKERGAGNEIQLTDAMAKLIGRQPFHGVRFRGTRYDCGDKVGYMVANVAYGLQRSDLANDLKVALQDLLK